MPSQSPQSATNVIVGAGVAGLVCALELARAGQSVVLIERQNEKRRGGLARWAFGGMALVGTELQQRMGVDDTPETAYRDWCNFADFEEGDYWPRQWAQAYVQESNADVYQWLLKEGFKFMPAVNWVERGLFGDGNTRPRYHVMWGTGFHLVETLFGKLAEQQLKKLVEIRYEQTVTKLEANDSGYLLHIESDTGEAYTLDAERLILACGGINGSVEQVRANWPSDQGPMPLEILNGAHPDADGALHHQVSNIGGRLTHLDKMWNYAAGIAHPQAHYPGHGLSLIPCKSALWLNAEGDRIGPMPLVTGFDTNDLCRRVNEQQGEHTWHVLNWKIATKELAISGSEHNVHIRDRNQLRFFKDLLFGNKALVNRMLKESVDFIQAETLEALAAKMSQLTPEWPISADQLQLQVNLYDEQLGAKKALQNDEQVRRIEHARQWRPDRLRTCKPEPLQTLKNGPFIAIRLKFISRKSLGGIQTNLSSQVLDLQGLPMNNLYAIGEAAGFGGGGISGRRSLEGTFLSCCVHTARRAASAILQGGQSE
ncbi:FAD-dependent oxidoreductase [Paraferrimonas sedimenticola]|uniref:FAD-binding dehydrogenase n=1 Tax=Paraferrimonas sedimenticola TaxID=375674 RepID=A0AA37RSZ7_9GAMM|nr:FAD-dependent oxidoreductase [Paraferrimonas sedimenticola]GLP94776.1 FAD-binding dehydrogenase [Paraferrimonas sedimenticola]